MSKVLLGIIDVVKEPSFLRVFFENWSLKGSLRNQKNMALHFITKPLAPHFKSPQSWCHLRRSTIWHHKLFWDNRLPDAHWCTSQDLHSRAAQFRPFPCCSSFCSHSLGHHSQHGHNPNLETSQPYPRTFCYNLKHPLRIREEHMWLYGHAMLKNERQSQSGSRRTVIV